jgi:glycosyltransferase involved in cell wall biosynthesis
MLGMTRALLQEAPAEARFTLYVPRGFEETRLPDREGVVLQRSLLAGRNRTLRILWEQFRLHSRVFRDGADLLHAPCYVMPVMCLKPVVLTVHDLFALNHPALCRKGNASHYGRMMPKSIRRAARVLVPTHAVKRELVDTITDIRSDRVTVAPWGVDPCFRPVDDPARREAVALKYGLPPRFVLHVGREEPKKNLRQVVEAYFAATAVRKLPHRLVLAGPKGWGGARLKRIIRELNLEEKVVRPGFIAEEDLPAVYSLAEALLFPSLAEGFGFPVLEAMACGTPVIAAAIPALREVAGEAALLVPPAELPPLREALERVLTEEACARELAAAGRRRAAEFTWQRHAGITLETYREVLAADAERA